MEAGGKRSDARIFAGKLLARHRPTRVEVDLVVLVLPLCTAAFTAVLGDGDLPVAARFFAVDALHQLGMARGTAPVALDGCARIAKRRLLRFILLIQILGHVAALDVADGWPFGGRLSPLGRQGRNTAGRATN